MKILLINPTYSTKERYGLISSFGPINEPLGLAYIAASLEKNNIDVSICDAAVSDLGAYAISKKIKDDHFNIVGITMLTPTYAHVKYLAITIKNNDQEIKLVVGGPHPTALPEDTLNRIPQIDYVITGEGEYSMVALVKAIEQNKPVNDIAGVAYRNNGHVVVNSPELIENLDDLSLPARHLLPMDKYHMTATRTNTVHSYTVSVARGCPFKCTYCFRTFGLKFRHHSTERTIEEIKILIKDYGAEEINLEADTLTLNKKFITDLCQGIIKNGLNKLIRWTCESRVDTVNKEILELMKEAGCWQISYGVESGSQRLLNLVEKGEKLEQFKQIFKLTKEIGISIRAFFMLGLPTETREESLETINFAKILNAEWSQFTIATPFPGTKLFELAKEEGGIRSYNWEDYKTHGGWTDVDLVYVPKERTSEELKSLQRRAVREFYLRPDAFIRFAKSINSFSKLVSYTKGFFILVLTKFMEIFQRNKLLIKIPPDMLEEFSCNSYVDSPVYFNRNPIVQFLNWQKLDKLLHLCNSRENASVLDFSCGNGVLFPSLSRKYTKTIAMDIHTSAANKVKQYYNLENMFLVKGDGAKIPFPDNSFDVVIAASALEHFKEIEKPISEIKRVLKKNGSFVFLSPSENVFYKIGRIFFGIVKPPDHYYEADEIIQRIEENFEIEKKLQCPIPWFSSLAVYKLVKAKQI